MKMISTKLHGALDYLVSALIIALPWMGGFHFGGPETWVLVAAGSSSIFYSLLTRYETGVLPMIPMRAHLFLDFLSAVMVGLSPWLFDFSDVIFLPHVIVGAAELCIVALSDSVPFRSVNVTRRRVA